MSFYNFPGFGGETSSFHPLVRLLDDFDTYSQGQGNNNAGHRNRHTMKSFNPKFDVKEVGNRYELHGEFPGVEQKDIEIEFIDDHTIQIKGHTEHTYRSGTPPTGFIESATASGAIEAGEHTKGHQNARAATVEDEDDHVKDANTQVAKHEGLANNKTKEPAHKFWVSERTVGDFSRSFSFPVRVDQDNVQATMKNGVLSIMVPKAQKKEARKITIT